MIIFHTNTIILLRMKQCTFVPRLTTATHLCSAGKMKWAGKGKQVETVHLAQRGG